MDNKDQNTDSADYHGAHEANSAETGDEAESYHGTHESPGSDQTAEEGSIEGQA